MRYTGTSACPEGKFYCINTGDLPRILFSSFVNDNICGMLLILQTIISCSSFTSLYLVFTGFCFVSSRNFDTVSMFVDCCDGSDEYESGIHCPNTCKKRHDTAETDNGVSELSVAHLGGTDIISSKHTLDIEDLIQKLRGTFPSEC